MWNRRFSHPSLEFFAITSVEETRKPLILRWLFRIISWSRHQPAWFHRLDSILSELRAIETELLDRLAVERIFRVRERRARQLMAGLPCLQFGNAVAISRAALIERLEKISVGDRFQWEIGRRARVVESLEKLRKNAAAHRVQVPAPADARNRLFASLPAGIDLVPGELRVRFTGPEDLMAKLFELSQAMANDWQAIESALKTTR